MAAACAYYGAHERSCHATDQHQKPNPPPLFKLIKEHVQGKIERGIWKQGDLIPTEAAFCKQFNVSRMTVNRALRELMHDGLLTRIQGSGTYVAQERVPATLIEIRSIAEDIRARGHVHSCRVLKLENAKVTPTQAVATRLSVGAPLYRSLLVHYEDQVPIQLEDRIVDAQRFPDYQEQDWSILTPNQFLMERAPLPTGSYNIQVKLPTAEIAEALDISLMQPCLVMNRTTYSRHTFASAATFWYPGNRYQLAGEV